jgi:hypothetical protein
MIHTERMTKVASAETVVGRAIATTTATAEIRPHADPEIDRGHQREDLEDQAASSGRESAETTTETVTSAGGHRSGIGIATMAGTGTTVEMTVMEDGTDSEMAIGIREGRGRKRRKRSPKLLWLRQARR